MELSYYKITCLDFEALRKLIALTGISGRWIERNNHCEFRTGDGAVLNYWKSKGTINFQGSELAAEELRIALFKRAVVVQYSHRFNVQCPLPRATWGFWVYFFVF